MKIAILFDNFGPYHVARLNAASDVCTLLGIELHAQSREYGWQPDIGPRSFHCVTLSEPSAGVPSALKQLTELQDALDTFRPDCLFVPGWSARDALAAIEWCRSNRVPAVLMSESTWRDALRARAKESMKSWIVSMCSTALVGGAPHAQYLVKLGMPPDRIFRGYDVVDNEYFHEKSKIARARAADLRQKLRLPQHYFIAVARFIPKKNLPWLIETYAKYRQAFARAPGASNQPSRAAPWSLVLLGDGPNRPLLEQLISHLNLDSHVIVPGFIPYEDMPDYYALAGAFVHASRSEPWGLVVNEAMASGLPVLVSNACGCAPDLVRDGQNGFLFDPASTDQLVQLRFSTQAGDLPAMGQAGVELISNWGLDRFASGVRAAAEKAVSVGPRSGRFWQGLLLRALALR
jgi:1,2-diacylglycerol 3-alpha-glucosyltransferase